ncbi:MAG: hypothetical protein ACRD33_00020 [Candidatus Acidiferrales bacterium]
MVDEKVPFTLPTKRKLTLPVVRFETDKPQYVVIVGRMHVGRSLKGTGDKSRMEPATLAECVDIESGELKLLICSAMVKSVLDENYPDDSYVGVGFQIVKHNKRDGKGYFDYSVDEVTVPAKLTAAVNAAKATAAESAKIRAAHPQPAAPAASSEG